MADDDDTEAHDEADLWFLPGPDEDAPDRMPGPVRENVEGGRPAPARTLIFLPLAIGGAGQGLRASGPPRECPRRWIAGAETTTLAALRHIEDLQAWRREADQAMERVSGRTPRQLVDALEGYGSDVCASGV